MSEFPAREMDALRPAILIIDNDPALCELIGTVFADIADIVATDTTNAPRAFDERPFDVVVIDYAAVERAGLHVNVRAYTPLTAERITPGPRQVLRRLRLVRDAVRIDSRFRGRSLVFAVTSYESGRS